MARRRRALEGLGGLSTPLHEVALLRLVAQRLVGPRCDGAAEAVRLLTAVQSRRQLTRAELLAEWEQQGLSTSGQRGYHLLAHLAMTGTLCLGPLRGKEQLVVPVDTWVRRPRELERDAALSEVTDRYFRCHGPATLHDLVRWTGLTVRDARAGLETARPQLAAVDVAGTEHLMDPGTPELLAACRREAREVFLLPGFDELVLGYGDRSAILSPELADRIVPGGNGVFRPTVVSDGRIVATWSRGGRRKDAVAPFTELAPGVAEAVAAMRARLP